MHICQPKVHGAEGLNINWNEYKQQALGTMHNKTRDGLTVSESIFLQYKQTNQYLPWEQQGLQSFKFNVNLKRIF